MKFSKFVGQSVILQNTKTGVLVKAVNTSDSLEISNMRLDPIYKSKLFHIEELIVTRVGTTVTAVTLIDHKRRKIILERV